MVRRNDEIEDDIDSLFQQPWADFTSARNALAARLKSSGRPNDASLVKAVVKPSISAWAVNQLYWQHRDEFDALIAAGQRLHKLQTSSLAGKAGDVRAWMDARRKALSKLSDLATSLLREAGHNPTPDTIRRVTTTLEALSSYASSQDGPTAGRLTQDVDPPGFDSLASMIPSARLGKTNQSTRTIAPEKFASQKARQKDSTVSDVQKKRQLEEPRRAKITGAKVSLQSARKSLAEARALLQRLEAAQKKSSAEAKEAEKKKREAEDRLKHARSTSEEATTRARSISEEARTAAKAVEEANRTVARVSKELELLFANRPDN